MTKKASDNTLREILEYEKYEVDEASDGEEGLRKAAKRTNSILCLCDIKMPKMDGIEVLERSISIRYRYTIYHDFGTWHYRNSSRSHQKRSF